MADAGVEVDESFTKTELTSVKEDFGKETDCKSDLLNEDVSIQENMMSVEDPSEITRNNEMELNPGIAFENHVDDSSSANSLTIVEDASSSREGEVNINNSTDIGGDLKNDSLNMHQQHDNEIEQNPGMAFDNHVNDTSATSSQAIIEDVLSSRESEQIENNLADIEVDLKNDGLCSRENVDIDRNNADINIEDDLKNGVSTREGVLIEINNDDIGGDTNNDYVNMQHDNEMEQNEGMAFEAILVLDASDLTSQKIIEDALREYAEVQNKNADINIEEDLKNDGLSSREGEDIENYNVDINIGGDLNSDSVNIQLQHDNEMGQNAEMIFENHVDDTTTSNLQTIFEDSLSTGESEDIENNNADINIEEGLKNGGLISGECEENDKDVVDIGEDLNNDFVNMQQQHEIEMQELRMTLQDEYQKQVLQISDELRDHYQNDMDEKIAKLEEDWELEFTKQKREFDEQVSAVQREQWTQCQEAIERVTLDAEDQLKNMKYAYERETAEHRQRIKELLQREALWEIKEKELANEKSEKENESRSKINKLENQLSFEREEVESQLNGAQDEIKTLKKQHESEVESLKSELDKKYSDVVDEMRKELKSKYQDEMDRKVNQVECHLREQYEQDLEKTKEEVQESTSTLKTKYEKQVTEIHVQLEELHERNQQHELREARLKENFESEKRKVAELLREVDRKTQKVRDLEQNKRDLRELERKLKQCLNEKHILEQKIEEMSESVDVKNCKEYKELEETIRTISREKLSLAQALEQSRESQKNEMEKLQQELQWKQEETEELGGKINDDEKNDQYRELEVKLHEITLEKKSLQQQLENSVSEISLLQEKLKEDESIANDLKSNYDTKILQITRNFEEEVNALENELKMKKSCEEEALGLKKDVSNLNDEIARLNEELQQHKVTILELDETSRSRELEMANLIINSPSPHNLSAHEFDFSQNSSDRTQQLENELAKYKKKVEELEVEAEDKFETTLCSNCQDREKSEDILIQTKALVEKIQGDCQKKVQSSTRDVEKMEKALQEQIQESEGLKAKLGKAEEALREERKRSLEISKLGKNLDVNENVLRSDGSVEDIPDTEGEVLRDNDEKIEALKSLQSQLRSEDDTAEKEDSGSNLPNNKDFESLFDEQEKFYKTEISRKDHEMSKLTEENEKIQQQVQNLKEKLDEGEAQYEQLRERTLEQKTKYENEINLMQNEIKMVIEENSDVKAQLEIFQKNQKETEKLRTKLQESEDVVQAKFLETKNLQEKLLETENMLIEKSGKYEQEIKTLKEILQEKENCISDLRNALELLENSRKELELDISNQKQDSSEREAQLLDEIREIKVGFENEKTKILEDSFLEKGEMKIRIEKLEMLLDQYNLDTPQGDTEEKPWDFGGYEGVEMDNSPEKRIDIRGYEGLDRDNFPKEAGDFKGKLIDTRGHEGINWDNLLEEHRNDGDIYGYRDNVPKVQTRSRDSEEYERVDLDRNAAQGTGIGMQPASETVQYEEINYFPADDFKHIEEAQSGNDKRVSNLEKEPKRAFEKDVEYKQGLEALWELKHEVLKDEYAGLNDTEFDDMFKNGSPDSLFSDGKYKEIGCEESLELLKYEHDIDLLLERKENERLRAEIQTLTNCVDVFHDECESLKRSLDKTVHMVEILRDERDGLTKENDLNMAEHSELVLDLIKYEETISRLEKGNEKLEDDRKLLEECLMQKESMISQEVLMENEAMVSNSPKTKAKHSIQDEKLEDGRKLLQKRRMEKHALFSNNPKVYHSKQLGSEVSEFPRKDTKFLRERNGYQRNETDFLRKGDKYQRNETEVLRKNHAVLERSESKLLEDLVKEAELESRSFLDVDTDNEDIMRFSMPQTREEMLYTQQPFGDDVAATMTSMERTRDKKKQRQDGHNKSSTQGVKMEFAEDNKPLHKERAFRDDFAATMPSMDSNRDKKNQRQDGNRKSITQKIEMQLDKDNEMFHKERPFMEDFAVTMPSMDRSKYTRNLRQDGKFITQEIEVAEDNEGYRMKNKSSIGSRGVLNHSKQSHKEYYIPSQHAKVEENRPKYRSEVQTSTAFTPSREMKPLQVIGTKNLEKLKLKTTSRQTSVEEKRRSKLLEDEENAKQSSKSKNGSIIFPRRDELSYNSRKSRNDYGITEHQKSMKSNSRNFSPKVRKLPRTPVSNISTLNSSKFSNSSILTSTRANLTTTDRLVPNLSGLSPIVSPLDRHYQTEKLKWQILENEQSTVSRANHDNTTFLLNVDPNGFLQTPNTPKMEGFHSKSSKTRIRSRSADDHLLTSSREMTRDLYLEKPLIINFEDFVFRHRVKSSENVANIRDPSPAELWFS